MKYNASQIVSYKMRLLTSARRAFSVCVAITILAACNGGGLQTAPAGQFLQSTARVPTGANQPDSIVYTPANEQFEDGQSVKLDLNNDGKTDFTFIQLYRGIYIYCGTLGHLCLCGAIGSLEVAPEREGRGKGIANGATTGWAAALDYGSQIGPDTSFDRSGSMMNSYVEGCPPPHGRDYNAGYWTSGGSAYLGLKFKIHNHIHYGWAQLTASDGSATLTGYAYQTKAGKSIMAGQK